MIHVYYNNIRLQNALTKSFRQEVVYDPSGTDHWFSRYTMAFEAIITTLGMTQDIQCSTSSASGDPHVVWTDIRHALLDPRHTLRITRLVKRDGQVVEEEVFRCVPERVNPEDRERDLGHGPKPTSLELLGMVGGRALRVRWEVSCEKLDLPRDYPELQHYEQEFAQLQTVLDNRWSTSEELDENFYLTRVIRGTLRLSRPVARLGWDYRWLAVPALEAGFKRAQLSYAVKEDGLTAEYQVTDKQVHTAAPWPATSMKVRNSRSTRWGVTYTGRCEVELIGPPHIPRKALVIRAIQIMNNLTRYGLGATQGPDSPLTFLPHNISISEEIGPTNSVTAEIEYEFTPKEKLDDKIQEQFVARFMELGKDLGRGIAQPIAGLDPPPFDHYDPNLSWMPSPYGYTTWGEERSPAAQAIFQCYLQRPYHPWHATGWWPAPEGAPEEVTRPEVQEVQVQRVEPSALVPPQDEKRFSDSHAQAVYTYSRMRTMYSISRRHLVFDRLCRKDDEGPTSVIVPLGKSAARRLIVVDAERYGKPPEIPAPVDYVDANGVKAYLLKYHVDVLPRSVSPAGDGWIYRLRAKYLYALDRAPPERDAYPWPVGRLPHTASSETGFDPDDSFAERVGPNPQESSE